MLSNESINKEHWGLRGREERVLIANGNKDDLRNGRVVEGKENTSFSSRGMETVRRLWQDRILPAHPKS